MPTHSSLKSQPVASPVERPLDIDAIFRRYARYVAAIGLSLLGDDEDVDDLIQEVFLVAVRSIEHLREPDAIKGWLATIAVRIARRRLRRRKLLNFVPWLKSSYEHIASHSSDPEQGLFLARIFAAFDELPVDQRIAWTLRHLEGERLEDVARMCGCSLATAKRRISAAHNYLEQVAAPWTT